MGHANPDMDCFGASLGVMRLCAANDKEPYIVIDNYKEAMQAVFKQAKEYKIGWAFQIGGIGWATFRALPYIYYFLTASPITQIIFIVGSIFSAYYYIMLCLFFKAKQGKQGSKWKKLPLYFLLCITIILISLMYLIF